jgi:hypothetical protein
VLTPVAPVDLSTVKPAEAALDRRPEPSSEIAFSVCDEPSA